MYNTGWFIEVNMNYSQFMHRVNLISENEQTDALERYEQGEPEVL